MGDDHIEHKMLSRGIENAQKRIESKNFDARKNLLEYDDVSNDQRQAIYSLRNQLLEEDDISETIQSLISDQMKFATHTYIPMDSIESQWKVKELENYLLETYTINTNLYEDVSEDKKLIPESIATKIESIALGKYQNKYQEIGDNRLLLEKQVMLQVLDVHWKEHLAEIDHLRNSIGLRAYAQKNPKNEFKKEAYSMFESMLDEIDSGTVRILFSLQIAEDSNSSHLINDEKNKEMTLEKEIAPNFVSNEPNTQENLVQKSSKNLQRETLKIGRNELVKITKGDETKEIKYKKAKLLIENDGWTII